MIDIMDLTVRELVNTYGLMYSPECDYKYGVVSYKNAKKMYEEFDLEDCPSVAVEELIDSELDDLTPLSYEKIKCIMENLGIEER